MRRSALRSETTFQANVLFFQNGDGLCLWDRPIANFCRFVSDVKVL